VVSGSLDFRVPRPLLQQGRRVIALTTESAPAERVKARAREGAHVIRAGEETLDGGLLCDRLAEAGYRRAYSVTGARVLHTLLWAGRLDTLFLTTVHRLIAGEPFTSLLQGTTLPSPASFRLSSLYYDAAAFDGVGQTFARYDRVPETSSGVNA
jgi:riboflavin biosynthesis pyrimidine reductase